MVTILTITLPYFRLLIVMVKIQDKCDAEQIKQCNLLNHIKTLVRIGTYSRGRARASRALASQSFY